MHRLIVLLCAAAAGACTQAGAPATRTAAGSGDADRPWAALHAADIDCARLDDPEAGPPVTAIAHTLDDDTLLYEVSCALFAYNASTKFYLKTSDGVRPVLGVDYSDSAGWMGGDKFINASFDPATRTIATFAKGRGLGDCGSLATYQWSDGGLFELVEYRHQEACGGEATADPEKWPLLYARKAPP